MWKWAIAMEFIGQVILELKIPEQDYYSDDDISAHMFSDSDILPL